MIAQLYSRSEDGHRRSYISLFQSIIPSQRASLWTVATSSNPALFLMIEERPILFFLVAVVRALFGLRTAGLLFRAVQTLDGNSLRMRAKRWALQLVRKLPKVTVISIVPFENEKRIHTIATTYIYDPQLWDLFEDDIERFRQMRAAPSGLTEAIRSAAAGRRTVVAIGRQDREKGIHTFSRLYATQPGIQAEFLFAAAGRISADMRDAKTELAGHGAFVHDQLLSDAEIIEAYAAADFVWCCYEPDYDQASGIFGRAVQLGIPPVVRQNSSVHRLARLHRLPHVAIASPESGISVTTFDAAMESPVTQMRDYSIGVLNWAIGHNATHPVDEIARSK